jgi:hypothetical protein
MLERNTVFPLPDPPSARIRKVGGSCGGVDGTFAESRGPDRLVRRADNDLTSEAITMTRTSNPMTVPTD